MSRKSKRRRPTTTLPLRQRLPWTVIRTVGVFVGVAGIWFYTLVNALCRHHLWDPFTDFVATAAGWVFRLFGADVYAAGPTLTVNGTTLTIDFGCNGLEAFGIFLAAVVASSSPLRRKLTGLLVGFVVVFILNLIRACGIFIAAATNPDLFHYVHSIVGQTFVIVFTMALYLWWEWRGDSGRKAKSQALPA